MMYHLAPESSLPATECYVPSKSPSELRDINVVTTTRGAYEACRMLRKGNTGRCVALDVRDFNKYWTHSVTGDNNHDFHVGHKDGDWEHIVGLGYRNLRKIKRSIHPGRTFEGSKPGIEPGEIFWITLASQSGHIFIFDVYRSPHLMMDGDLGSLLTSPDITKVMYSGTGPCSLLFWRTGAGLQNIFDIQICHEILSSSPCCCLSSSTTSQVIPCEEKNQQVSFQHISIVEPNSDEGQNSLDEQRLPSVYDENLPSEDILDRLSENSHELRINETINEVSKEYYYIKILRLHQVGQINEEQYQNGQRKPKIARDEKNIECNNNSLGECKSMNPIERILFYKRRQHSNTCMKISSDDLGHAEGFSVSAKAADINLRDMCQLYGVPCSLRNRVMEYKVDSLPEYWRVHPITETMKKLIVDDIRLVLNLYEKMTGSLNEDAKSLLLRTTNDAARRKIPNSVSNRESDVCYRRTSERVRPSECNESVPKCNNDACSSYMSNRVPGCSKDTNPVSFVE